MRLPAPIRWLKDGWMAISHAIGMVMSRILLSILWIVCFGVYAVIWHIGALLQGKKGEGIWESAETTTKESLRYQF